MACSRPSLGSAWLVLLGAAQASAAPYSSLARTSPSTCPAISGTFSVDNYQLYPENLDWDPINCKLYISAIYNASVLVYDPYTATSDILTFSGITDTYPWHISGIDYDAGTKSIFITANSGVPWTTAGANMTGGNSLIRYDTITKSVVYNVDLEPLVSQLPQNSTITPGGFQDSATDAQGSAYVPVVFHTPAIAKISASGDLSVFHAGAPVAPGVGPYLYFGICYHAATAKLIVTAPYLGSFVTFDTTSDAPAPVDVTMTGRPADNSYPGLACDGLTAPKRYGHKVLLCCESYIGTQGAVTLWATTDDYASVAYIGKVENNSTLVAGGVVTATVELENAIFISSSYFNDGVVFNVAGPRAVFPLIDATAEFDAVVAAAGFPTDTSH